MKQVQINTILERPKLFSYSQDF